mmetsp:Transcript_2549/g.5620  ORF Transcript_2549/g.5620 Transcript_2549/m.5620 type:complete len:231 (-) Transcript_2549:14-706(-)
MVFLPKTKICPKTATSPLSTISTNPDMPMMAAYTIPMLRITLPVVGHSIFFASSNRAWGSGTPSSGSSYKSTSWTSSTTSMRSSPSMLAMLLIAAVISGGPPSASGALVESNSGVHTAASSSCCSSAMALIRARSPESSASRSSNSAMSLDFRCALSSSMSTSFGSTAGPPSGSAARLVTGRPAWSPTRGCILGRTREAWRGANPVTAEASDRMIATEAQHFMVAGHVAR